MLKGRETTNGGVWMSNAELKAVLVEIHACAAARRWVGNRDLYRAWMECPDGAWLRFFFRFAPATITGMPRRWAYAFALRRGAYGYLAEASADEMRRCLTPRMVK